MDQQRIPGLLTIQASESQLGFSRTHQGWVLGIGFGGARLGECCCFSLLFVCFGWQGLKGQGLIHPVSSPGLAI